MLPSSHAHPLSPPLESDSRPSFLSDYEPDNQPLFPPSPEEERGQEESIAESDEVRRGSTATLSRTTTRESNGIGLGLPRTLVEPRQEDDKNEDAAIPSQLVLPSAPHLVPSSQLSSLPLSHLVALTQTLSRNLEIAQLEIESRRRELLAIEGLAREKGASEGEIERAKVRIRSSTDQQDEFSNGDEEMRDRGGDGEIERTKNRTLKKRQGKKRVGKGKNSTEWRIDLIGAEEEGNEAQAQVEVDLDIEDLTEAISSNAFIVSTSPDPNEDDTRLRNRALSLPAPSIDLDEPSSSLTNDNSSIRSAPIPPTNSSHPSAPSTSSTLKPASRGRHASLSARIFGSLGSSSILAPPPVPTDPIASSSPSDNRHSSPSRSSTLTPSTGTRSGRSASIRSVSSVKSTSSKASDTASIDSTGRKAGGGYSDWFGWKGWNGGSKASAGNRSNGEEIPDEEEEEEAEKTTRSIGEQGDERSRPEDLSTPVPNQSSTFFDNSANEDRDPPTPRTRKDRLLSNASSLASTLPRDPPSSPPQSSSAVSSSSRRTSTTRSTLPSTFTDSPSSPSSASLCPPMRTPEGRRSPPGATPPESPTTSRTRSPVPPLPPSLATRQAIATPALSTPMTTSTLSHPSLSSPRRPSSSISPRSSQTLELPPEDVAHLDSFAHDSRNPSPERVDSTLVEATSESRGRIEGDQGQEVDGQATLKARSNRTISAPPTFVPGVPLYTAPSDSTSSKPSDQGYVAAAKGTIGRALGLGASTTDGSSSSSSATGMIRSPSDGVRRAINESTGVLPRMPSLSLSRYSLFSQPALSTPSTSVSISAGHSPATTHSTTFAPIATVGTPTTMELDTISAEVAPPSLALLKPTSNPTDELTSNGEVDGENGGSTGGDDGPLIDRYGFIYDVHSGMELLKENRRRDEERDRQKKGKGKQTKEGKKKETPLKSGDQSKDDRLSVVEPSGIATPTQLEVHPQMDALREAMGLTPTSEQSNAFSPETEPSSLTFDPVSTSTTTQSQPPKLVRAPASDDSSLSRATGNSVGPQSMRALLTQLRTMSDAVEKTQQVEWDQFIRKRQKKLAKLKQQHLQDQVKESGTNGKGKSKKERPKTVWGANALAEEKVDEDVDSREEHWTENLVGVAQMGTEGKSKKEDWNEFKDLVRKGIPISYRPKIWGECSSANEAREPGVYQELLFSPREDEQQCLKQIDMDCHRTFPTNVFFAGNGPGVAKLHNVLVAYSRRNPKIGYCQGMNNLVATLLLTHPAEEDAFWVLVCIVENILPSDYYTSHLLVSRADQQVLNDLVARLLPTIAAHLEEQGVELSAISFGWFLSLFTDVLPIQTLLRVWDLFFIHGTVLLFRVALAILKMHETELLACDSAAGLYGLLGSLPGHIYHADKLLKVACEDLASTVKDREISTLRRVHAAALQEELAV